MAQDTPSRKLDQYIVRFPDGMRDRLKAIAAENNRSLNAEIISRLDASVEDELTVNQLISSYWWLRQVTQHLAGALDVTSPDNDRRVKMLDEFLNEMDASFRRNSGTYGVDDKNQPLKMKAPE